MLDEKRASEIRKKTRKLFSNLPATLIAGKSRHNGVTDEIKSPVLSIDKVTLMLRTRNMDLEQKEIDYSVLKEKIYSRFPEQIAEMKNKSYFNSFIFQQDETEFHVSFNPAFSEETRYGFRIEFNPNKIDYSVLHSFLCEVCGYLAQVEMKDFIKFNRLDIAIDLPIDLNPNLITVPGSQKSFVASGSKGIESIYFGHRSSDYFLRVYNKKLELLKKQKIDYQGEHLWRVELELKKEFHIDQPTEFITEYFSKINFFQSCEKTCDWQLDLILFKGTQPGYDLNSVLKEIPSRTRDRYKKKLRVYNHKACISLDGIIRRQFPKVFDDFKNKLKKSCEASPF